MGRTKFFTFRKSVALGLAAAASAALLFVVCGGDDPVGPTGACDGLTVATPGSACCVAQPNFNGCQVGPSNPCEGQTSSTPGSACCIAVPNFPGCTSTPGPCDGLTVAQPGSACCNAISTFPGCFVSACTGLTVANPGSACCAEQPNFNGCQASNPCTGLTTAPPGSACCQHNPNFNGCQVSNPCAGLTTAPPGSACCQHTPTFNGCQGGSTGQFCRWDADPNNCWPIDPASADPNTQSAANCMAEHGEVVSDCNAASTVQYCDWGPPAIVAGDTVGGCFAIPGNVNPVTHCTNDHGIIVSACPNYPPPTEGGFCDYGFGNCIGSAQSMCNQYGAFGPSCPNPSGFYCDFGQPTGYGDGGCYFRPSMASISGALNTAGDCDEWADRVSMTACIASNTTNPCISDPVNPGDGGPAGCNPNPRL